MRSLLAGLALALAAASTHAVTLTRNIVVPPEHFGLHIHRYATTYPGTSITTPWPSTPFGAWRLWDAYTRWADLEPAQNQWNWTKLDAYVDAAAAKGVEVTLVLGSTPRWASARPDERCPYGLGCAAEPTNFADWDDYVRTVAQRYAGRIRHYELWNEPQFLENETVPESGAFYSGYASTLVELGRRARDIIHSVDPQAKLLAPATTSHWRYQTFLKAGGGAVTDIVSYHFYNAYPEQLPYLLHNVRQWMAWASLSDRPLWGTEVGYRIGGPDGKGGTLSETGTAAYLSRAYLLGAAGNLARMHWYSWDGGALGLTTNFGATLNAPGRAFATTRRWLVGATLQNCANDPNDGARWTCPLTRAGRKAWVMWRTDAVKAWRPPSSWKVVALEPLDGPQIEVQSRAKVNIGPAPVLLKADTNPWQP